MSEFQEDDPLASVNAPMQSGVAEPRDHSRRGLRIWISVTCTYLGTTPTELAKTAGLAASTVNRFMRTDEGNLSARTIEALISAARLIERKANLFPAALENDKQPALLEIPLMGTIAAEDYRAVPGPDAWQHSSYSVQVPILAPFKRFRNVGFEITDDHAEPEFPAGTIVIMMYLRDQAAILPAPGDFVLAYRGTRDTDDGPVKLEITVRKLVLSPSNEIWMVPLSTSYNISEQRLGPADKLVLNKLGSDQRPLGLIVSSIRPIRR